MRNLAATMSAVIARLGRLEGAYFDARNPADPYPGAVGSLAIQTPGGSLSAERAEDSSLASSQFLQWTLLASLYCTPPSPSGCALLLLQIPTFQLHSPPIRVRGRVRESRQWPSRGSDGAIAGERHCDSDSIFWKAHVRKHMWKAHCGRAGSALPIFPVRHWEKEMTFTAHSAGECEKLRQAILPPLCSATACYVCSRSVRAS